MCCSGWAEEERWEKGEEGMKFFEFHTAGSATSLLDGSIALRLDGSQSSIVDGSATPETWATREYKLIK